VETYDYVTNARASTASLLNTDNRSCMLRIPGLYSDWDSDSYLVLSKTLRNNLASYFLPCKSAMPELRCSQPGQFILTSASYSTCNIRRLRRGHPHICSRCADCPLSQNRNLGRPLSRATHRPHSDIYSFFPAFRAPSFLYIIPIYTYIIPTAPQALTSFAS